MSGLFRRLSSRRSAGPDGLEPPAQAEPGTADAPTTAPTEPGGHESLLADPAAQTRPQPEPAPVVVHPLVEAPPEPPPLPVSDLPAGLDPDELAAAPLPSARRSRLRRRISFLRAAREVLLRDLGGFIYEIHRTAADIEHEAHRRLREIKLTRLTRLDAELHALELQLDDVRRHVVVREPGVGGECPHCGELFGSDAHFCSHCGMPLTESARKALARMPPAAEAQPGPGPSTEELAAPDTEFHWPRRDEAGEGAAGEPAASEPVAATTGGEAVTGEPAARGDAVSSRPETGSVEATHGDATAREPAADGDEAARGEPVDGEQVTGVAAADDEAAPGDAATREPTGDQPAAGGDEAAPATAREPAGGEAEAPTKALPAARPEGDEPARNGRDETVLRPVERRT